MRNERNRIYVLEEDSQINKLEVYPLIPDKKSNRLKRLSVGLGIPTLALTLLGTDLKYSADHADQIAQLGRQTVGDEITSIIEEKYLAFDDWKTRKLYKIGLGPDEKPFDTPTRFVINPPEPLPVPTSAPQTILEESGMEVVIPLIPVPPEQLKPKKMILPDTHILLSTPLEGEGSWSTEGLPTTDEDLLMARTLIRPDPVRPYSNVTVLLLDSSRIKLNMVGGKGSLAVGGGSGPGKVPDADLSNLLVVMNGGFQISHAPWGMYEDGIEYQALRPGYASIVTFKDGSIKMGTWGVGDLVTRTEDMEAVRQNAVLLVEEGEVTKAAKEKEADVNLWGRIAAGSAEFITWRSAIGLTKDGNLIIASGSSMSAYSLARGLQAAGAYIAMQLDINNNWMNVGIVTDHHTDGVPILTSMMKGLGNGSKFLRVQDRDFMYLTLKEK